MKLLLTDAGVRNVSIRTALIDLLGKPIAEADALFVPTGLYALPHGAVQAYRQIVGADDDGSAMTQLGWKSVGLLELTALPSIDRDQWVGLVKGVDAILVEGGDPMFLHHWMRESGLADLFDELTDTVYVGLSAGSMIMTPCVGPDFVHWNRPGGDDTTLALVDFSIYPHMGSSYFPHKTVEAAEKWAATMPTPVYATDEQTAITVIDGKVEVVSEGNWRYFG
jgi:dipeptidase E